MYQSTGRRLSVFPCPSRGYKTVDGLDVSSFSSSSVSFPLIRVVYSKSCFVCFLSEAISIICWRLQRHHRPRSDCLMASWSLFTRYEAGNIVVAAVVYMAVVCWVKRASAAFGGLPESSTLFVGPERAWCCAWWAHLGERPSHDQCNGEIDKYFTELHQTNRMLVNPGLGVFVF